MPTVQVTARSKNVNGTDYKRRDILQISVSDWHDMSLADKVGLQVIDYTDLLVHAAVEPGGVGGGSNKVSDKQYGWWYLSGGTQQIAVDTITPIETDAGVMGGDETLYKPLEMTNNGASIDIDASDVVLDVYTTFMLVCDPEDAGKTLRIQTEGVGGAIHSYIPIRPPSGIEGASPNAHAWVGFCWNQVVTSDYQGYLLTQVDTIGLAHPVLVESGGHNVLVR